MKEFSLRGSIVAIVTPFKLNGEIDFEAYDRLVEWYIQEGTDGIVVCGTTGETPALNADEDAQMIERTVKLVNGRVTVIAGTGSNSTEECIKYSQKAQDLGVDAVLVVGPYYNKPTDKGMYMHFSKVAQSIDIPVVLYVITSYSIHYTKLYEIDGYDEAYDVLSGKLIVDLRHIHLEAKSASVLELRANAQ